MGELRTVGLGLGWDELKVGDRFKTISRTVTETDLVNFINATGMLEVLFTDAEYAKEHAPVGGRLVPGALVYCFAEGLLVQSTLQHTGLAFLEMSFQVKGPTFVGDTIHVEVEVLESRPTSKSPDRGVIKTKNRILNQNGQELIVYEPVRLAASSEMKKN